MAADRNAAKDASRAGAKSREIIVGMALAGEIVPVGVLKIERSVTATVDRSKGRFRYAASYLGRIDAVALDPVKLPLKEGEFHFVRFGGLPSCIRDAAPDNWGRILIRRYYVARGVEATLSEADYLLASPRDRAGNLHFATDFDKDGVPAWDKNSLRPEGVEGIAEVKQHVIEVLKLPEGEFAKPYPKALDALLTGSGGARPKLTVLAPNSMYMVKLAHPTMDAASNARLEEASMRMGREVGISTAEITARSAGGHDFLVVKRFDRPAGSHGARMQMVSAMTVLDADDHPARPNWSYPMLARELDRWSSDPEADKMQLFRCMVLRAMLSDSDDHPRNYALMRDPNADSHRSGGSTLGQWRLSPMYDCVVGCGKGLRAAELAMEIGRYGYEISERNFVSQADAFGLTEDQARIELRRIERIVLAEFPRILAECRVDEAGLAMAQRSVVSLDERPNENAIEQLMSRVAEKGETVSAGPADEPTAAPQLLEEAGISQFGDLVDMPDRPPTAMQPRERLS